MFPQDRSERRVPGRALLLSLAALAVPVMGALRYPTELGDYGALLWLLALVPAFLQAYHRGWKGVATALAAGMATLSLTQVVALWLRLVIPDLLLGVAVAYLAIALAVGWIAEMLHRQRAEVEDMALTDLLTRLPNRRHARVFLDNEFAAAQRGRLLSVVLFDLDRFKQYNDKYGHQAGDEALRAFADVLAHTTRRMNLSARFGGEEFLSVLAGSDEEGAVTFAERVRTALQTLQLGGGPLTVSAGVASHRPGVMSADDLLAAADRALYQAKHEGRNCVRLFTPVPASAQERHVLAEAPSDEEESPDEAVDAVRGMGSGRRVLLVEDEVSVRQLIHTYLEREGFSVSAGGSVPEGMRALKDDFDVVVTDIHLPGASGRELVSAVKSRWPNTQVLVMTGLQDAQVAAHALDAGADRYLFKPFGLPELRSHLVDALSRRDHLLTAASERKEIAGEARELDVQARAAVLKGAAALVRAVEVRDPYTRGHGERVARYAAVLADVLDPDGSRLPREALATACRLHDVGKISVPSSILNKPAALTEDDMAEVRTHPRTGRRLLNPLLEDELVLAVVSWHHERWDGEGYPDGLEGESIPLAARLVALVNALDAMTSERAYRPPRTWGDAITEIRGQAGGQFDPDLMASLDGAMAELRRIHDGREE